MGLLLVIFEGQEYIILHQYACGYCEIRKEDSYNQEVKLVHFSELKLKN
ncbi:hypothetical protein [Neobacillus sp. DY30]|nr:hypothetical protein [Neobacillus sp. DY30]WHX98514.1 hypothetical protein QNH29_17895 [Neobacillus sp. DY30]